MEQPWRQWWPIAAGVGVVVLAGVSMALNERPAPVLPTYHDATGEEVLRATARDPAVIARGQALFRQNCTLCHGTAGQGVTGPNLRDEFWLRGADQTTIVESIANGNPARGMAPWQRAFPPADLHALAAFIASLQGTEDGSGKAAEGARQPMMWRSRPAADPAAAAAAH
jgi:mono/diheme cytochrome c family protein